MNVPDSVCTSSAPSNSRKSNKNRSLFALSVQKGSGRNIRIISVASECPMGTYLLSDLISMLFLYHTYQRHERERHVRGPVM